MVQLRLPTRQQASVFINKLEAARRQLDAAIRMTFTGEDVLAIHTVAAAAYRILRDLLDKRGRHDLEELYRAGLYVMAHDFVRGKLSASELKRLEIYDVVSAVAERARKLGDDFLIDDVPLSLSDSEKRAHWQTMSGISGFLKHADRTPEGVIALNEVDNESLILHAGAAYSLVSHTSTPEMAIFHLYWLAADPACQEAINADQAEVVGYLRRLTPSKRRLCLHEVHQIV
jgi:hypothetical protein